MYSENKALLNIRSKNKALLKRTSTQGVEKRHKEQFVGWFERKVSNVLIFMTKQYCNCALSKHYKKPCDL
jgi:hypothetical protein